MSNMLLKRIHREKKAREMAENLLEKKSLELYKKNQELNELLSQTSEKLEDLSIRHLELFENSVVGIALTYEGEILQVNKTFADLLGYSKEKIVGLTIADVTFKDDVNISMQNTKNLHKHNIKRFSLQKRYKRKNGSYFWASTNVSEVKNKEGKTLYHLAVIMDIHKEKMAELKLQQTIHHLIEVNENLENFAHIVSHDLKAPITGINTVLQWMEEKMGDNCDEDMKKYVSLIQERTAKMYNLIEDIISYSKTGADNENKSVFNSKNMVQECLQVINIPSHTVIKFSGNFPEIKMNKTKFVQIFTNLIDNSVKHIDKDSGLIKISVDEDERYYHFKVYDNGSGIPKEEYKSIFELYSSMSKKKKSTGIGLNLVKKIVEQYGGKIFVQSEVDYFTEFTFTLPKNEVNIIEENITDE